jgi:hypothetical protein
LPPSRARSTEKRMFIGSTTSSTCVTHATGAASFWSSGRAGRLHGTHGNLKSTYLTRKCCTTSCGVMHNPSLQPWFSLATVGGPADHNSQMQVLLLPPLQLPTRWWCGANTPIPKGDTHILLTEVCVWGGCCAKLRQDLEPQKNKAFLEKQRSKGQMSGNRPSGRTLGRDFAQDPPLSRKL